MARDHLNVLAVPTLIEARALHGLDLSSDTIVVWQSGNQLRHADSNVSVELYLVPHAKILPVRVAFRWTSRPRDGLAYWQDGGKWIRIAGNWYAYEGHYLISSKSAWSFK